MQQLPHSRAGFDACRYERKLLETRTTWKHHTLRKVFLAKFGVLGRHSGRKVVIEYKAIFSQSESFERRCQHRLRRKEANQMANKKHQATVVRLQRVEQNTKIIRKNKRPKGISKQDWYRIDVGQRQKQRYFKVVSKGETALKSFDYYTNLAKECPKGSSKKLLIGKNLLISRVQADLFYQSPDWLKLRQIVFDRDGKRCACCGEFEGHFHIDHIKPLRVYWHLRLDPKNMQILCRSCNIAKGNWCEKDFRRTAPSKRKSRYARRADFSDARLTHYAKQQISLYTRDGK